jgi:hypothetical protein
MRGSGELTPSWTLWALGGKIQCRADNPHRFTGPKITLNLDDLSESQERALAEEGLDIEGVRPVEAVTDDGPIGKEDIEAIKGTD